MAVKKLVHSKQLLDTGRLIILAITLAKVIDRSFTSLRNLYVEAHLLYEIKVNFLAGHGVKGKVYRARNYLSVVVMIKLECSDFNCGCGLD